MNEQADCRYMNGPNLRFVFVSIVTFYFRFRSNVFPGTFCGALFSIKSSSIVTFYRGPDF